MACLTINGIRVRSHELETCKLLVSSCSGVCSTYTDDKGDTCVAYGRMCFLLQYHPFPHSDPLYLIRAEWFDDAGFYGVGLHRVARAPSSSFLNRSIFALLVDLHPSRIVFAPVARSAGEYAAIVM